MQVIVNLICASTGGGKPNLLWFCNLHYWCLSFHTKIGIHLSSLAKDDSISIKDEKVTVVSSTESMVKSIKIEISLGPLSNCYKCITNDFKI